MENFLVCFNTDDLENNVKFNKKLINPIIIPENKDCKILMEYISIDDREAQFDIDVYINNYIKILHIELYGSVINVSCFSSNNKLPKTINEFTILFDWNPPRKKLLGYKPKFRNLEIDFYFKEIPTLWIENEKKEECGICYDKTNLTTRCKQFKHYVCKECFPRIKNICPYCTNELTEIS